MTVYKGKGVYGAVAIGKASVFKRQDAPVRREIIDDPAKQLERVRAAKELAVQQLRLIYEKALKEVGETDAEIFEIHIMMLEDEDYKDKASDFEKEVANKIAKQNENNPMKALQGRVPGMNISADGNPSGAATVRIRGLGTLNNNDPLYIIDGVPTKSGMHELNGNDIESIQVLKDAASASIYGSRAANGVIIITTKRGKEGKVRVDFDGSVAASFYAHKIETLNARQFGQALWQANINDGKNPNNNIVGYNFDWGYDQNGHPQLYGVTMDNYLDANGTVHAGDTDWFDEVTRTGIVQQYNLSVSSGSEKGSSFFSMGYYDNKGTIKESEFSRLSARANTEYKLLDGIVTIGENFTLNRTKGTDAPGDILRNALQFSPNFPIYAENGEYAQPVEAFPERENPLSMLSRTKDNAVQA